MALSIVAWERSVILSHAFFPHSGCLASALQKWFAYSSAPITSSGVIPDWLKAPRKRIAQVLTRSSRKIAGSSSLTPDFLWPVSTTRSPWTLPSGARCSLTYRLTGLAASNASDCEADGFFPSTLRSWKSWRSCSGSRPRCTVTSTVKC
ncbi:hypothetical protein D3C81_610950 [compost metagenome]